MSGVQIREIAMYHPAKEVGNDYYIKYFADKGTDVTNLVNGLGRNKRFVIDNPVENSFTMALEASKAVLDKAGLQAADIDLIIFTSQTPEYLLPSNALKLHHSLGGDLNTACFDINANCAGMLVAIEQAARYMASNPRMERALVVGADYLSVHTPDEPVYHSNVGEVSVAVVLEPSEATRGLIDSVYQTDTSVIDNSLFPAHGLSNLYRESYTAKDAQLTFTPFDDAVCAASAIDSIQILLSRNEIGKDEVAAYLFSQFTPGNIKRVSEGLDLNPEKVVYIGDQFGYTLSTSPLLALHQAIQAGQVKRGDYLVLWTVGAGWQNVSLLLQY